MANDKITGKEDRKQFIFHTSGSAGEPKIIQKSYECVLKEGRDLAEFFNFRLTLFLYQLFQKSLCTAQPLP